MRMLPLWGTPWSKLGCKFWNGFRALSPYDSTVISNVLGEVKFVLKYMAKAPICMGHCGPHKLHIVLPRI